MFVLAGPETGSGPPEGRGRDGERRHAASRRQDDADAQGRDAGADQVQGGADVDVGAREAARAGDDVEPGELVADQAPDRDRDQEHGDAANGEAGRLAALLPPAAKGVAPEVQAAKAQLGQLAQALAAAKAQTEALKQDRSHDARKLEIEAFEAETNRMRAMQARS